MPSEQLEVKLTMDISTITVAQFDLVFNAISFGVAVMLAATAFFFLQRTQVARANYDAATVNLDRLGIDDHAESGQLWTHQRRVPRSRRRRPGGAAGACAP